MTDDPASPPSARTRLLRNAKRGVYDRATIEAVLDACQLCQVAYVEGGEPRLVTTLYLRDGDYVYLHGNRQAALLRHLGAGGLVCLSVMAADGVVVARSGFHCSMNYRSVVLYGHGEPVPAAEHRALLDRFVDVLIPGHGAAVRAPTAQELAATASVRIPIAEASAKIRTGPPLDDDEDLAADVWAGVLPLATRVGTPEPSPDLRADVDLPDYLARYRPRP